MAQMGAQLGKSRDREQLTAVAPCHSPGPVKIAGGGGYILGNLAFLLRYTWKNHYISGITRNGICGGK